MPVPRPLLVLPIVLVAACSSSSSDGGAPPDAADAKGGSVDPGNCVAPASKPNDKGMGGYCSPGGHQCDTAGPSGAPRICTADVPDTPAHAWFCTYPCSADAECGADAYCATDRKGKGCVPVACKSLQDAGVGDTGGDSGTGDSGSGDAGSGDVATDVTPG